VSVAALAIVASQAMETAPIFGTLQMLQQTQCSARQDLSFGMVFKLIFCIKGTFQILFLRKQLIINVCSVVVL
jgi:hypothetical protein